MKNKFLTFVDITNYNTYFIDFSHFKINSQLKQIYDNIKEGLTEGNKNQAHGYFHKNILLFEEQCNKNNLSFISKYFKYETDNWTIVQARTLYSYNIMSPLNEVFAQITAKYNEKTPNGNVEKYIVFERRLSENVTFHSWKVFVIDYNDKL